MCLTPLTLALLWATTACDRRPDIGPVVVTVIGGPPALTAGIPRTESERVTTGALADGLVRFDAAGQIEPGMAERWIVIDEGLRYIFRLRPAEWSAAHKVDAEQVAAILKRRLRDPRNPLAPFLTAITDVVAMTPQVLEVRLDRPRPGLLNLFAQPELAIVRRTPTSGAGRFRTLEGSQPMRLTPTAPRDDGDDRGGGQPESDVTLAGAEASHAVAQFALRQSDLVLGGTFATWPLVVAAGVAPANYRIDPAAGLFGFVIARREGLLADADGRALVAAAINRATIVAGLAPAIPIATAVLPERLDSAAPPVDPVWASLPASEAQTRAMRRVAVLRATAGHPVELSVALPSGPGAVILFRRLRLGLARIGVTAVRVDERDPAAQLRLIDRVAPYDSARWYLRTACSPCGEKAGAAIEAARTAPSNVERARALALADAELAADVAFIPIARPVRWSLVSLRLPRFQGNPRAWHPLDHLRNEVER